MSIVSDKSSGIRRTRNQNFGSVLWHSSWCLQSSDTDWCQAGQVDLYWCCVERSSQDFADQAPPDPITLDTPLFHPQPHHLLFRPNGASPNSHKHFFPYMGFCVLIWDNVRHHCHRHHHHHHIQKSKSINTEACLIAHWLKLRYGLMMQAILGHAGDFITVWKKEKSTRPHGNPLCFPKNIFCLMWCNWKRMAVLESA